MSGWQDLVVDAVGVIAIASAGLWLLDFVAGRCRMIGDFIWESAAWVRAGKPSADELAEFAKFAALRGQVEEMARAFAKYSSHRTNCARRLHSEACDCGASEAAELFVGRIRGPRR